MMRYNIHHILVIENGELSGVVTNHDFMVLQGSSPTSLVRSIEKQGSFESIAEAFGKVFKTVSTLLREGARAEHITGLITEVTEKLIDRTIELIEVKIGPAPLPYSMFIYGDGGRRELTLNPVLRLGIAYTDTEDPEALSRTSNYFNEFREIFLEALGVCGLKGKEILPGEYIKGYAEWKGMFEKWSSEPFRHEPDEGLFEMRAVRGEEEQITALRGHLASLAGEHEDFMDYMATKAVENRPPLGFFGKLIVEKTGEHRNELNLYSKGLKPIADSIRIFSLEKGVRELATHKRILALGERYEFEADRDVEQAMEYLLTLLLHHQLVQMEKSEATDDFLNPEALANLEKKTLKESFQLIANLYDIIEKGYRTERSPS
jgi:CBS domain-containing protein